MDKNKCRVCGITIEKGDWEEFIAEGYKEREENWGAISQIKSSIRLYVCPNCGVCYNDHGN